MKWLGLIALMGIACVPAPPKAQGQELASAERMAILSIQQASQNTYLMIVKDTKTGACVLIHYSDRGQASYSSQSILPYEACR